MEFLNDTISYYKNELGQEIAQKAALQGDKKTLELLLSKQVDSTQQLKRLANNFRKVHGAGNVVSVTRLDSIFIPYSGLETDPEHDFRLQHRYYEISGRDQVDGIRIDHLKIPNTLSLVVGKKKTGFFSSEFRVEAVNSNPYVRTIGLDHYVLKIPRKRFGLSLYAGYGLSSNFSLEPSMGVAVTWNLIRF